VIVVSGGEMLILKRFVISHIAEAVATIRQHLAILREHVSLRCVVVGSVSRSVGIRLNIYSKLAGDTFFFSLYFSGFA
jgi:hypothetical protein